MSCRGSLMEDDVTLIIGERNGGKSTTLTQMLTTKPWCTYRGCGIIAVANPQKSEYYLHDLVSGERRVGVSSTDGGDWEPFGRFYLNAEAFCWANGVIGRALANGSDLAVFDEIGRLEMKGGGLHPSFTLALTSAGVRVLATIRDIFLTQVTRHYRLDSHRVHHISVGAHRYE
jgi:nucleoside-triphosphatase THEP1